MTRAIQAAACAAGLLLLALPGAAGAAEQTASAESGTVRADLRWDDEQPSQFAPALRITRPGGAYDYAPSECGGTPDKDLYCETPRVFEGHEFLIVRDIDGDGEPEVLVEMYSGGAHCCSILRLYKWDGAANTYASTKNNFADVGFELRDVEGDGKVEFVSADPRFAYAFASFADSRFPIQILAFTDGDFDDVTARYPALIRADAREQWNAFREARRERREVRGVLAAYLADQFRLGRGAAALRQVRRALRPLSRRDRRYLRSVRRYLKRWGYAGRADFRTV
jgi:hypothetical protein